MADFDLTKLERASPVWARLKGHMQDRLATMRLRNDNPQTEAETAVLRGEIRCLKSLLALDNDRPFLTGQDDQPR
jgi:hypothetical protein